MKFRKLLIAGAVAGALALSACGSSDADGGSSSAATDAAGTLTVWLQTDAQQGWPELVDAASAAVKKQYPNVTVNVEYQTWPDHLTKLDAALAGTTPPDVVELGNTEMTKYMAAGALADLTSKKGDFDNSATWLNALTESATFDGALYGVPYYAGSRAVIYNTDIYKKAGVTAPTTYDAFLAGNDKLMAANASDKNFSAYYFPGKNWYGAMPWVYDQGGAIAVQDGNQWKGSLDSPEAQKGLEALKQVVLKYSKADKTGDESKQDQAFAQGSIAAIYGNGWERGVITDPKTGNPDLKDSLGAYPLPSLAKPGTTMPAFLGGSDLAVTSKSANQEWAVAWIKAFTSTESMTAMVKKGVLPNTTSLLDLVAPADQPFAKSAANSWFVPTAPNWVNVEKANVLPNMLVDIFTEKKTVAQATADASAEITKILNES